MGRVAGTPILEGTLYVHPHSMIYSDHIWHGPQWKWNVPRESKNRTKNFYP